MVCSTLNMTLLVDKGTYLGIPFMTSKIQSNIFQPIIQKLSLKNASWHQQYLSKAERLIMIQLVLQAIPLHVMSCIKIPHMICDKIDQFNRAFYWKRNQNGKKIH